MKKKITIILLFFLPIMAFAQDIKVMNPNDTMIYSKAEIERINHRIIDLMERHLYHPPEKEIYFNHIFHYGYFGQPKKHDFRNGNFIKLLLPFYDNPNDEEIDLYVDSDCLLSNKEGKLLAVATMRGFYTGGYQSDKFILEKKKELGIRYLFIIGKFFSFPVFGLTEEGQIYIFVYKKGERIMVDMEEFLEMHDEDFVY